MNSLSVRFRSVGLQTPLRGLFYLLKCIFEKVEFLE